MIVIAGGPAIARAVVAAIAVVATVVRAVVGVGRSVRIARRVIIRIIIRAVVVRPRRDRRPDREAADHARRDAAAPATRVRRGWSRNGCDRNRTAGGQNRQESSHGYLPGWSLTSTS